MGFGSIQLGLGLLVKVEALVILGEVKVYTRILLYSNKLKLFSVLSHVGHSVLSSLSFSSLFSFSWYYSRTLFTGLVAYL